MLGRTAKSIIVALRIDNLIIISNVEIQFGFQYMRFRGKKGGYKDNITNIFSDINTGLFHFFNS